MTKQTKQKEVVVKSFISEEPPVLNNEYFELFQLVVNLIDSGVFEYNLPYKFIRTEERQILALAKFIKNNHIDGVGFSQSYEKKLESLLKIKE